MHFLKELTRLGEMLPAHRKPLRIHERAERGRRLIQLEPERDIFLGGQKVKQRIVLVHDSHATGRRPNFYAIDNDLASLRWMRPENRFQERALAASAGADQGHNLTGFDAQVDIVQDSKVSEPVRYVLNLKSRFTHDVYSPNQGQSQRRNRSSSQSKNRPENPRIAR